MGVPSTGIRAGDANAGVRMNAELWEDQARTLKLELKENYPLAGQLGNAIEKEKYVQH